MNIRTYRPGDEKAIQLLFEKVFNHKRSMKHWEWKFIHTPEPTNPFILLYEEDGDILGHLSLWINNAYINGKIEKIGLRVDTMVDPEARGKGIYRKLTEEMLKLARQENIQFLYGFPAPKARELFLRYTGATEMVKMPRLMYILQPVKIASQKFKFLRLFSSLDKIYLKIRMSRLKRISKDLAAIKEIYNCDSEFDQLSKRTKDMYNTHLLRNAAYLNWRYFQHPDNNYRLFGYYKEEILRGFIVIKADTKDSNGLQTGMIVDLMVDDLHDTEMLNHLVTKAISCMGDTDLIQTWILPEHPFSAPLKKLGFLHLDSPLTLVGKSLTDDNDPLLDYHNWFISLGDVDSY